MMSTQFTHSQKKLLYLSQVYPYPADTGGKIKSLNSLLSLSKSFLVHAVFISEKRPSTLEMTWLRNKNIKVSVFYKASILSSPIQEIWSLVKGYTQGQPRMVSKYWLPTANVYIQQLITHFQPDVIHFDQFGSLQYRPPQKNQIWIYEEHNVESELAKRRSQEKGIPVIKKIYLTLEYFFCLLFEKRFFHQLDRIFTISDKDKKLLERDYHLANVTTQPLVYSSPHHLPKASPLKLLFIGTLQWPPNQSALLWFQSNVLPQLAIKYPAVELHVVGHLPAHFRNNISRFEHTLFHGYQRNLEPFLTDEYIFILPFTIGSGVHLKVLTALAAGIPIVSTPQGVEGLHLKSGQEFLLAQNAQEFLKQINTLHRSQRLRKRLIQNGLRYLPLHHGAQKNREFLNLYQQVI